MSHRDAAALWGLLKWESPRIHVTTERRNRYRPGITLHRCLVVDEDRTAVDGIPVTSTHAPCSISLRSSGSSPRLALEEAERHRLFELAAINRLIACFPRRSGMRSLRAAIEAYSDPPLTRSELERHFLDLCAETGLSSLRA